MKRISLLLGLFLVLTGSYFYLTRFAHRMTVVLDNASGQTLEESSMTVCGQVMTFSGLQDGDSLAQTFFVRGAGEFTGAGSMDSGTLIFVSSGILTSAIKGHTAHFTVRKDGSIDLVQLTDDPASYVGFTHPAPLSADDPIPGAPAAVKVLTSGELDTEGAPRYGVQTVTMGARQVMWLQRDMGHEAIATKWSVLDVTPLPPMQPSDYVDITNCYLKDEDVDENENEAIIVAIAGAGPEAIRPATSAWRVDLESGRFVSVPAQGVTCNEANEED